MAFPSISKKANWITIETLRLQSDLKSNIKPSEVWLSVEATIKRLRTGGKVKIVYCVYPTGVFGGHKIRQLMSSAGRDWIRFWPRSGSHVSGCGWTLDTLLYIGAFSLSPIFWMVWCLQSSISRMPCHDVTVSRCGWKQQTGALLSLPGRSYLKLDK